MEFTLPGTVYRFSLDHAASTRPVRSCSLHQGDVLQYARLAEALGMAPKEVVLVGIQPESFSPGEKLSPTVEAAVVEAANQAITEATLTHRRPGLLLTHLSPSPTMKAIPAFRGAVERNNTCWEKQQRSSI